ncbi:MAG: ATP-binding protein, partial [Nanoarchaeota archaeon]
MNKTKQEINKEIIALSTFEAVRLRSEMYIGQVAPMDDKLPIIENGKLISKDKVWSPGFMHLIVEILENAIDEAKRMNGKMKKIYVKIDLDTNRVTIRDEGDGFYQAHKKHSKTKKNVVRTAFEELHSGSNFTDSDQNILGTHGVGSSICNILSEEFEVTTVNKTHKVHYKWNDFKIVEEKIEKKQKGEQTGTEVSFIPSSEVFKGFKWDIELIKTYLSFKSFLLSLDNSLSKLEIEGIFLNKGKEEVIEITRDFLPKDRIEVINKDWGS